MNDISKHVVPKKYEIGIIVNGKESECTGRGIYFWKIERFTTWEIQARGLKRKMKRKRGTFLA